MNSHCNYKWISIAIAILYRPLVLVMNKNKFLVWSKWTNEKDTGMFGVWTYWRKRIIKKRNLSTAGFLLKKKVYNRTISVAYILSYSAFENRFAIKKNDKTHVCCIMFKIYNFKTLSSFNLLLNKKRGGGHQYEFLW